MSGRVVHLGTDMHQEVQALLPWYVGESLDAADRTRVEAHIAECPRCQAELAWERELQAVCSNESIGIPDDVEQGLATLRERIAAGAAPRRRNDFVARLRDRWRDLSTVDRGRPLLLVAHGPSTDTEAALWISDLERAAKEIGGDLKVQIGLLRDDAAPPVRAAAIGLLHETVTRMAGTGRDSVAVLPVLISSGRIDGATSPKDLSGLPVSYIAVSLAPHPALARWIERVALAKAESPR